MAVVIGGGAVERLVGWERPNSYLRGAVRGA
jgi:hypothetical protein